jgi:hypothetical protein
MKATPKRTEIITAYCWQSGEIQFTSKRQPKCPAGTIPIITGPAKAVKRLMNLTARHGYKPGVLLVPGLPEYGMIATGKTQEQTFLDWRTWALKGRVKLDPKKPLTIAA